MIILCKQMIQNQIFLYQNNPVQYIFFFFVELPEWYNPYAEYV